MQNILEQLKIFKQQLIATPNDPDLNCSIAKIYYNIRQIDQAIYHYKKTIVVSPNNWNIYLKLANCYIYKDDYESAISYLEHCLTINPECIDAAHNLGMLLVEKHEFAKALPYLERAYHNNIENQKHFEFIEQLANCYIQLGDLNNAIKYLSIAAKIDPNKDPTHHNLGILYLQSNNHTMANKHFKQAIKLNPNNTTARHMLNALNKITTVQPPSDYVSDLFNQYANYYEKQVTTKLNYKLPNIFRSLYAKYATITTAKNTLDLGCGTGLCGIYFRDATINLIGLDLAKNMLFQAKKHGCYDLLIASDLQTGSVFINNYFDLIIAADLFPYFGSLENIFNEIARLMNHNNIISKTNNIHNMFIFNTELLNCNIKYKAKFAKKINKTATKVTFDYQLQVTGRYAHTIEYIKTLTDRFNFTIVEYITTAIRTNLDIEVPGTIFVLTKNYI